MGAVWPSAPGKPNSSAGVGAPGSALATAPRLRKVLEGAQVTSHGASLIRSASGPSRARAWTRRSTSSSGRTGSERTKRRGRRGGPPRAGAAPSGRPPPPPGPPPPPPADVDHQQPPGREGRPAPGGQVGQARLLDPRQHLDGDPGGLLDLPEHVQAVAGLADGRGGEA